MASLGLDDSRFDKQPSTTTADDIATLMRAIAKPDGVSKEARQDILELLLQEGVRDGIVAGVPGAVAVAHKTAAIGVTHDVGLVWGPKGPYIIAILSDTPGDWATVAGVSRLVYDYFNS
jgi:beta-lactamase class A